MGDVALTVPIIRGITKAYPDISITLVTRRHYASFFSGISQIRLFYPETTKRHKGLIGLYHLYQDLKSIGEYDYIFDLQDNFKTRLLTFFFKRHNIKCFTIDKQENIEQITIEKTDKKPLKHTTERYRDVFKKANIIFEPEKKYCFMPDDETLIKVTNFFLFGEESLNIGIAPYAIHPLKSWPEEYMIQLMHYINSRQKTKFWLFGSYEESEKLRAFNEKFPEAFLVAGQLHLHDELAIMGKLDFMISMDSSNMHMASLSGTKVISIWGSTDPIAGFAPWQQPDEYSVRIPIEQMPCRPCTINGKGKCKRGDFACMRDLKPEMVYEHLIHCNLI